MGQWSYKTIELPLKYKWTIARGSSIQRKNIIVSFKSDNLVGQGEIAFITGGEFSHDMAVKELDYFISVAPKALNGLEDMMKNVHQTELHSSVKSALEVAYLNYLSQVMEGSLERILAVDSTNKYPTSYSLPILSQDEYEEFIKSHNLDRFEKLKIKVSGVGSAGLVNKVASLFKGKLWLDGNEAFESCSELEQFCSLIPFDRVEIFEQPFSTCNLLDQKRAKEKLRNTLWFADESLQNGPVTYELKEFFDGVNIKLMKSGGLFSALRQAREARSYQMKIMLGCMLETSLGIHAISSLATEADFYDLDSFLFLEKDPFNLIDEEFGLITKGFQQ